MDSDTIKKLAIVAGVIAGVVTGLGGCWGVYLNYRRRSRKNAQQADLNRIMVVDSYKLAKMGRQAAGGNSGFGGGNSGFRGGGGNRPLAIKNQKKAASSSSSSSDSSSDSSSN
jgi:hypothetical protein